MPSSTGQPIEYLTRYVAEFICNATPADLPSVVVALGKKSILDGLGLALSGGATECGVMARRHFADLHLGVGPHGRLATLDNALLGCARFGLTRRDADDVIDRIWRVVGKWKDYFEGFGVPGAQIKAIAGAFREIDEVLSVPDSS